MVVIRSGEELMCTFKVIVLCETTSVSAPSICSRRPVLCLRNSSQHPPEITCSWGNHAEVLLLTPGAIVAKA